MTAFSTLEERITEKLDRIIGLLERAEQRESGLPGVVVGDDGARLQSRKRNAICPRCRSVWRGERRVIAYPQTATSGPCDHPWHEGREQP